VTLWRLVTALATAGGLLIVAPAWLDRAGGQSESEYALYYRFEVPVAIGGMAVSDEGTKKTFNGTLRGTLGGIQITEARYTYANGASERAGGGTFSMSTKGASFKNGQILMTSDGRQTTLLFFGLYLGAHVSFTITGPQDQIGGSSVIATGLAETNFRSHEQYVAAVREATTALPPAERDQITAQADRNAQMVREYQQRAPH
jgi:hypothetical protein